MKKLLIPAILFIGLSIATNAQATSNSGTTNITNTDQKKSSKEVKGDKHYFVYSFDKAIDAYVSAKQLTTDGQRKLAKSYFKLNRNGEAETAYSKLMDIPEGNLPEDYFNYAMVLKANSKYEQANTCLDKFSELKPTDLRAKDYQANKNELNDLLKDNGKYEINTLNLNTGAIDFGTSYYKNSIVFASSRTTKLNPQKANRTGQPYLNMYVAEIDNGQLKDAKNFDADLNEKMHDGPASFNKTGTFMAFTKNNYNLKKKELIVNLEIYFRTFSNDKWSEPEAFVLNNKEYSVSHPSLSADGNTMYFSSNLPGGFGGVDIYRVTKDAQGVWSKQENLGDKINTESDEMFPFYEENSGTLFFTSNGRFGLGGMDIFRSDITGNEFGKAVNIGTPLNTQYDDFAVITDGKMEKGYFSSNRAGGKGFDDIYAFTILGVQKQLTGIAKDAKSNAISNTFITLFDEKGNIVDTSTTKSDGAYSFQVQSNKMFKLIGEKNSYSNGENTANTNGKELIVKADVTLLKKKDATSEKLKPGVDLAQIGELQPIYFDLDKFTIRPDAENELNKIVKLMNTYPDMIVELGSHTDCRETKAYNQILSDKRAKASTDYVRKRITKPSRITGKGYSKTKLINACSCEAEVTSTCSEEEHQKNRRTEFIIIK